MANEVRLIDANLLARKWQSVLDVKSNEKGSVAYQTFELFIDRLKEEPTIDPESLRPKGRWESNWYKITCSSCNHSVFLGTKDPVCHKAEKENFKFCPNCGADMRGVDNAGKD